MRKPSLFDREARNALGAVGAGADHGYIKLVLTRTGDELLRAVDDEVIPVTLRRGLERGSIGARGRLGQAVTRQPVGGDEPGQILVLHRLRPETVDHPARHVVDRDERAGRGTAIGHRLHDQRRFEPAEADPAAFLGDIDRAEAEFGRGLHRITREDVFLVPLGGVRGDRVRGELARHLLDRALVFIEIELVHHPLISFAG